MTSPDRETLVWSDRAAVTRTSVDVVAGVCVVRIEGVLGARALQPCRAALDAACVLRPRLVVLDVERTAPPEPVTVTLLGAMRRYLRARGAEMTLAAASPALRLALRSCHVIDLYDLQPSASIAVARARLERPSRSKETAEVRRRRRVPTP